MFLLVYIFGDERHKGHNNTYVTMNVKHIRLQNAIRRFILDK